MTDIFYPLGYARCEECEAIRWTLCLGMVQKTWHQLGGGGVGRTSTF